MVQKLNAKGAAVDKAKTAKLKIGDKLAGLSIKRIRIGSNDKHAIIGRFMGNDKSVGVRDAFLELKATGKKVEIFDKSSLTGSELIRFNKAITQFELATNGWKTRLTNNELMKLDIYTLNREWALKLKNQGYTVIDMGDFNGIGFSVFYELEKSILF